MWGVFNASPDDKVWFYDQVANVVRERLGDCTAARELRRAVDEVSALSP